MLLLLLGLLFPCQVFLAKSVISSPQEKVEIHQQATERLIEGQVLERELMAGQNHTYQINLNAGQYLKVVVEQQNLDVSISIYDTDGKQLSQSDSPGEAYGKELLALIAQKSGDYTLEVQAAPEQSKSGKYQITITDLREPKATDNASFAAQQILSAAYQDVQQGTEASFQKAIEKYQKALTEWRLIGDQERIATTLFSLGAIYGVLNEHQKALEYMQQALPIVKAIGSKGYQAQLMGGIGSRYQVIGEDKNALDYFQQALIIYQSINDTKWQSYILYSMGVSYSILTETQKALDCFNQVLALPSVNIRLRTLLLSQIGTIYDSLGEYQKALDFYQQALVMGKPINDRLAETGLLSYIGAAYVSLGEYQKGLEYLNQALAIERSQSNRPGESGSLEGPIVRIIGTAYRGLAEYQKALDYYQQALKLAETNSDQSTAALTLNSMGQTYYLMKAVQKATDAFNQALIIAKKISEPGLEASVLLGLAMLKRDSNEYQAAMALIEQAMVINESLRANLGVKALRASFSATAQNYYEFYIDLLMRLHQEQPAKGYDAMALQTSERARARTLLESLTEARVDIRAGIDAPLLDRERSLRKQLNTQAANLLELFNRKHNVAEEDAIRQETEKITNELQYVERLIYKDNPHYAALKQPQPLTRAEIQQQVLDDDTVLLEYALGKEQSYVWAITRTAIASYQLPKREVIESAALRVYQLFTARERKLFESDEKFFQRLKDAENSMAMATRELSNIVLTPLKEHLKKKRLLIVSDGLLQYVPFAALPLPASTNLVSHHKSAMKSESIAADWTPLMITHEVTNLPSASSLAVQRQEFSTRKMATNDIIIFANPVFSPEDNRVKSSARRVSKKVDNLADNLADNQWEKILAGLSPIPETEKMAKDIIAITPKSTSKLLLGFDANLTMATRQEIGQYRIVHYATHGFLSPNPELSGIVLSLFDETGKTQNGFLSTAAIFNLNLPVDLVVLSACRTGLALDPTEKDNPVITKQLLNKSKDFGVVGLTQGFVYAGAARVMVTLWNIPVEASAELMVRFYKEMLGPHKQSPAAALRTAQIQMFQQPRWKNPYYWAAFVINGEYK